MGCAASAGVEWGNLEWEDCQTILDAASALLSYLTLDEIYEIAKRGEGA